MPSITRLPEDVGGGTTRDHRTSTTPVTTLPPAAPPAAAPPTPAPTPTTSPDSSIVDAPPAKPTPPEPWTGPRSKPPDGMTWVDATLDRAGHWERLRAGQVAQGAPVTAGQPETGAVTMRTHETGDAYAGGSVLPAPTLAFGNWPDSPNIDQMLLGRGLSAAQVADIRKMRNDALGMDSGPGGKSNDIDRHLAGRAVDIDGKRVYAWFIDQASAETARARGMSPAEWYVDQWVMNSSEGVQRRADQAAKDAETAAAAKAAAAKSVIPVVPLQQTAKQGNTALIVAGAAAVAYLLLS